MTDAAPDRAQLLRLGAIVILLHVLGWGLVWRYGGPGSPALLGLATLAYTFGLRHAFDADHIAAIDNTTRRLMQQKRRPFGVGLFFSLGHSTVVLLMTIVVALAARTVTNELPRLHEVGRYVGAMVSGLFLYAIGIVNLILLVEVYRGFRRVQRGDAETSNEPTVLVPQGIVSRWLGPVFSLVTRPWHVYPIGFLFGLGFDTATEIALLTTAGIAASQALPLAAVLSLPVVFAAGMAIMDTADGVLMCGAYGWAFANPLRKVFYNLTITGLSVVIALLVGTIELLSIAAEGLPGRGGVWMLIRHWDPQATGYVVVGVFLAAWAGSVGVWRLGRFER
jgi:high-affinity nickel-transport protein